jgi:hypothetical protein
MTAATIFQPRRASRPLAGALGVVAFVAGCVVLGLVAATVPLYAVALVLVGLALLAASWKPDALGFLAVLVLGLVPVYAAPKVGPLNADPAVLLSWLAAAGVLLSIMARKQRVGLTPIDGLMAFYVGMLILPVIFGNREKSDLISFLFPMVGPYLAMRLLVPYVGFGWLPKAFAIAALLSLPFVLVEAVAGKNLFDAVQFNAGQTAAWGDEQYRFGVLRAEGAFGQAISLSQFAATVMLIALGAAILRTTPMARRAWIGTVLIGGVMLAASYSRTGWIVLGVGIVLVALLVARGRTRARLLWSLGALVVLGFAVLEVTGQMGSLLRLVNDDSLSGSNTYRDILLERALHGEGLAWFGELKSSLGSGIDFSGSGSIDNAYLAIGADWGYVGLIGFLAVALFGMLLALWRLRGTAWSILPIVVLANLVGLVTVAINTQTTFWLWMLIGAASGACTVPRPAPAPAAPAAVEPPPPARELSYSA